jgi:hypothetical protein
VQGKAGARMKECPVCSSTDLMWETDAEQWPGQRKWHCLSCGRQGLWESVGDSAMVSWRYNTTLCQPFGGHWMAVNENGKIMARVYANEDNTWRVKTSSMTIYEYEDYIELQDAKNAVEQRYGA